MRIALALLLALRVTAPASAAQIRRNPAGEIYLYEVDSRRGLTSAMLSNVAIVNDGGAVLRLTRVDVELTANGDVRGSVVLQEAQLDAAARRMAALKSSGMLDLYDFAFQLGRYLDPATTLAGSTALQPNAALILPPTPLLVPSGADALTIRAVGTAGGAPVETTLQVPLRQYVQKNVYRYPLRGAWLNAVGPGFSEPHRWAPNEEFAMDIIRVGASGKSFKGNGSRLSDYYGRGQDVVAAADGVVVAVEARQPESSSRLRQPGESAEDFMKRTVAEQQTLLKNGPAGVAGNYVVIRHAGGEHSHYAHLAAHGVRVTVGANVKQGDTIARLGSTGNSTEPHLHFGVADGPDPLYARSLPVRFSGITTADGPQEPVHLQSGWIVEAQ